MSKIYIGDTPEQLDCGIMINGELWSGKLIAELQQRNAELELLLHTAEQNAADQRGMKAKARKQRDEQVKKNAELAAQIERLRNSLTEVIIHSDLNTGNEPSLSLFYRSVDEAAKNLRESPAKCLAERDREVAARAGRDGFIACAEEYGLEFAHASKNGIERNADKYYSKIKSGEVKING